MLDVFWIPLLPPFLGGLILSFGLERLLRPAAVAPWRRPLAALGVHLGVWLLAFAFELALFRRPYFAVANVLAIQLLIIFVSNAKFHALREPFVYSDFEYFKDAIKHPRLYLPFFGVAPAVASGGAYGLALWIGLMFEEPVTAGAGLWFASFVELSQEPVFDPAMPLIPFFGYTLALAAAGLLLAWKSGRDIGVSFDACDDLKKLGLIASLWRYAASERKSIAALRDAAPYADAQAPMALPELLPDLVVIQSESFFDARRLYPELLQQDVLANFDLLRAESAQYGRLKVAAWGANTVRTEFAFLSGMSSDALGVHRYNPYRKVAASAFPTIASYLKKLGYRTLCVHPYHRSFYQRDKILPLLGFDEFIGIEAFLQAQRDGPYVGDRALGARVAELMQQPSTEPLYVHVITMENHGPLHWESINQTDVADVMTGPLPDGCQDLVAYARHLRNADAMFGALRQTLIERKRPASLCLFGDHVPIMPAVYRRLGQSDGTTDYLLWRSDVKSGVGPQDQCVDGLAAAYLKVAGLSPF